MATVLTTSERADPVLTAAEVGAWPPGVRDRLVRLGLLAATGPAAAFACTACGFDHVEPVQWVREPGRDARVCVACAEAGLVWLDPAELERWAVRLPTLAGLVAGALGAAGGVRECVPRRVWKLGTVRAGGRAWVGVLAVGLARADGASVVGAVPELRAPNALVFVPSALPAAAVWGATAAPVVVSLCDLLALGADGLVADLTFLESSLPPPARLATKGPTNTVPTPPGATWEQVALAVDDLSLAVRVGTVAREFGFAAAGFENRRTKGVPDELWTLLRVLARRRGELGPEDGVATKSGGLKTKVSALRKRLRALLALADDPFHPNLTGQPYRARFAIRCAGPETFPTPPGATWDDISLTETAAGTIVVGATAETRGAAYLRGDEEGDRGRWEGTTDASDRQIRYTLADLGLAGPDDAPTPAGEALAAVLRAGGRLARPVEDEDLLALGGALTRFFGIAGPPFEYDPGRRRWVARFEAASVVPASDR